MREDFPAAHSMDTEWFAVDADGRVALFQSGEGGPVPETAPGQGEAMGAVESRAVPDAAEAPPYRKGAPQPSELLHDRPAAQSHVKVPYLETLMFLDELGPVQRDLDAGGARIVRASEGEAVVFAAVSKERFDELHAAGACRGCRSHYEDEGASELAALGVYVYGNDSYEAGPYERLGTPSCPASIDRLPEDIRAMANQVKLPVKFADAREVQPVDLVPCVTWGAGYVPIGETEPRPVPGREDDFAKEQAAARAYAERVARGQTGGSGPRVGRLLVIALVVFVALIVLVALLRHRGG
jgi:hypothetical protein